MTRNQIQRASRAGTARASRRGTDRRDRRDRDHVHVLGQEEQREAHRAVLGVVAGDQLLLGFRKVERRAVGLRDAGRQEDEEPERLQEDVPLRNEAEPVARLLSHDLAQRQRTGQHDDRRERQAVRQLVADHLRRRAQAAEQRVLAVRAPAGEHDAVDAHRRDREDHEQPDVDVGRRQLDRLVEQTEERRLGAERHDRERGERRASPRGSARRRRAACRPPSAAAPP